MRTHVVAPKLRLLRVAQVAGFCLVLAGCSRERTFTLRSDLDPARPWTLRVTAAPPNEWPTPELDRQGGPCFFFGPGVPAFSIALLDVAPGDVRARIDDADAAQLFPADTERTELADGRRWVVLPEREPGVRDAALFTPGPGATVVYCYLRAMPPALFATARGVCEGLRLDQD